MRREAFVVLTILCELNKFYYNSICCFLRSIVGAMFRAHLIRISINV
jgi:hypothetical protein